MSCPSSERHASVGLATPAGSGDEYYTARPLIRAMVKVIDPRIGETFYDGTVGSAGLLCEA